MVVLDCSLRLEECAVDLLCETVPTRCLYERFPLTVVTKIGRDDGRAGKVEHEVAHLRVPPILFEHFLALSWGEP